MWRTSDDHTKWVVRVVLNDTEGAPGETLHGPFDRREDAASFAQDFRADDTEVQDAWVECLNPAFWDGDDRPGHRALAPETCAHIAVPRYPEVLFNSRTGDLVCPSCGLAEHPNWWRTYDAARAIR